MSGDAGGRDAAFRDIDEDKPEDPAAAAKVPVNSDINAIPHINAVIRIIMTLRPNSFMKIPFITFSRVAHPISVDDAFRTDAKIIRMQRDDFSHPPSS